MLVEESKRNERKGMRSFTLLLLVAVVLSIVTTTTKVVAAKTTNHGAGAPNLSGLPYVRIEDLPGVDVSKRTNGGQLSLQWHETDEEHVEFLPADNLPTLLNKQQKKMKKSRRNRNRNLSSNDEEENEDEDRDSNEENNSRDDADDADDQDDEADDYDEDEEDETGKWDEYNPYSVQPFVEGMSEYDEYQQAWRMLGFMIDCNSNDDDEDEASHNSRDGEISEAGCARYILWAAVSTFVDDRNVQPSTSIRLVSLIKSISPSLSMYLINSLPLVNTWERIIMQTFVP